MKDYLVKHPWKIIEDKYHPEYNQISESIFSIGNGRMGQRANFEESFTGHSLQGSYIAGIYYPDKTRVGWWKNGYPEYFAKVLNSVNWIGIDLEVNGKEVDLAKMHVASFERVLDMQKGLLQRITTIDIDANSKIRIESERFYSAVNQDLAILSYRVTNLGKKIKLKLTSYLDFDVRNEDSNYDENFWTNEAQDVSNKEYWVKATTKKTQFTVLAVQRSNTTVNGKNLKPKKYKDTAKSGHIFQSKLKEGESLVLTKTTSICSTFYYPENELKLVALKQLNDAEKDGYDSLKNEHAEKWNAKWQDMDVTIEGDAAAQQGIRFNIFQLHQTYSGEDPRLNIGPKGFTGEKYGGSTYWDTEAYCLPFYMSTAEESVGRNLLKYRYNHLEKAIENAEKLGFTDGAALYPMVTMNGEECHNEWEITFEEIHRNGAIAYAIFDYVRYTDDQDYITQYGFEVLTGIARFWAQRVHWSEHRKKYVMLGVTGPNEYENNVDNNWYTNYIAKWCLYYARECYMAIKDQKVADANKLLKKLSLTEEEMAKWVEIATNIYLPESEELGVFLQQEGYLDKEQKLVSDLRPKDRPINQNWSWDRILRSPFIKQADVLQGLYFFLEDFSKETVERNFDYYEPRTVHESSLSPCVHAILAAYLGKKEKAYEMYLRTSRLDLDDYNNDTEDGLHITSMAGSWLSVIKGFAGMRVKDGRLNFAPFVPDQWDSYSFRIRHRKQALKLHVKKENIEINNQSDKEITVIVHGKNYKILEHAALDIRL